MGLVPTEDVRQLFGRPPEDDAPALDIRRGVAAVFESGRLTDQSFSTSYQTSDALRESMTRFRELGGPALDLPWPITDTVANTALDYLDSHKDTIAGLREAAGGPPDPLLQTGEEIRHGVRQRVGEARSLAARAGIGAQLVGGLGVGLTDPFNLALMPLGAAAGESLIAKVVTEAAIGGLSQTGVEVASLGAKERGGVEPSLADSATNVALTAGLGAGLAGAFHGVGLLGRRAERLAAYRSAVKEGRITPTRATEAAADSLQDAIDTTPPLRSAEAEAAHLDAVEAATHVLRAETPEQLASAQARLAAAEARAAAEQEPWAMTAQQWKTTMVASGMPEDQAAAAAISMANMARGVAQRIPNAYDRFQFIVSQAETLDTTGRLAQTLRDVQVGREVYMERGRNAVDPPRAWIEEVERRLGRKLDDPQTFWEFSRTPMAPKGNKLNEFFTGPGTQRFRESVGRDSTSGAPENPNVTFESAPVNGRRLLWTFGDKTPQQWVAEQTRNLTKDQLKKFKVWYDSLVGLFRTHGYTERDLVAWAANNQNQATDTALGGEFKVMDQLAGYPVPKGKKAKSGLGDENVRALLAGGKATFGPGMKLPDFSDASLGRATRVGMGDDVARGEPFVADLHTTTDRGHISRVILNKLIAPEGPWVGGKLNGVEIDSVEVTRSVTEVIDDKTITEPTEVAVHLKDGSTVTLRDDTAGGQPKNYEAIVDWGHRLTKYLNETKALGRGKWKASAVQAVGWMNVLLRRGEKMQTPDWFMRRQVSTHAHELAWGDNSPLSRVYPPIALLDPKTQANITFHVLDKVSRDLAKIFGGSLRVVKTQISHGVYGGAANPNVNILLAGSNELRKMFGDALAYLGQQSGVWSVNFDRGDRIGAFLRYADKSPMSVEDIADFIDFAAQKGLKVGDESVGGASYLSTDSGDAHFIGGMTPTQAKKLHEAFLEWGDKAGKDVDHTEVKHAQTKHDHDWKADPSGGTYLQRVEDGGRAGLAGDVRGYGPRFVGHVEDAFAKHAPGLLPEEGRAGRIAEASGAQPSDKLAQTVGGEVVATYDPVTQIAELKAGRATPASALEEFWHHTHSALMQDPEAGAILRKHYGEYDVATNADGLERAATDFLTYVETRKAPTKELTSVFQRVAAWMKELWSGLTGFHVPDEVRGLFEKLDAAGASSPQIQRMAREWSEQYQLKKPPLRDFDQVDALFAERAVQEANRAIDRAAIAAEIATPTPIRPDPEPGAPDLAQPHLDDVAEASFRSQVESAPDLRAAYMTDNGAVSGNARELMAAADEERTTFKSILDCVLAGGPADVA